MSIWDTPTPDTALTPDAPAPVTPGPVATSDPGAVLFGTQAGPLLSPAGRGVVNGAPYGEALLTERSMVEKMYRLRPQMGGRLLAATRKALGR